MHRFHNKRGGIIRLATDAPVYAGVPTDIEDNIARKLLKAPHVVQYLASGSLTCETPDGKTLGKSPKKAKSVKTEVKTEIDDT